MRPDQWRIFKQIAKEGRPGQVPCALIVDSPWIPGHLGITHFDYYDSPDVWFKSNLEIVEAFPDITMLPSWWVEYGMAIEPSSLGARALFHCDQPPGIISTMTSASDVARLPDVNPLTDGLMAFTLHRYRTMKQRVFDAGYTIPMVAARGPVCTAAFVRGLNDFLMDLLDNPSEAHQLLELTTRLTIDWLTSQVEAIGPSVEGLLILDDIPGLMSRNHYLEFAHPYLTAVFQAFPKEWVKVYHNDANTRPVLDLLPDTGFDVLNWGKTIDLGHVAQATGGRVCLLGNLDPLETGVRGTPEEVEEGTRLLVETWRSAGRQTRWIFSLGGGVSPGMPGENIAAISRALRIADSGLRISD